MLQTVNIASTWKRRKRAPSWPLIALEVRLAAEFGRRATAADLTALAAVAFGLRALRASDALTASCHHWTVSCSKLPIRVSLNIVFSLPPSCDIYYRFLFLFCSLPVLV